MTDLIAIVLMMVGVLFLGGSIGRARMRGDRLASGQALIGVLALVGVTVIAVMA